MFVSYLSLPFSFSFCSFLRLLLKFSMYIHAYSCVWGMVLWCTRVFVCVFFLILFLFLILSLAHSIIIGDDCTCTCTLYIGSSLHEDTTEIKRKYPQTVSSYDRLHSVYMCNLVEEDTTGIKKNVLIREVSSFQRVKCMFFINFEPYRCVLIREVSFMS